MATAKLTDTIIRAQPDGRLTKKGERGEVWDTQTPGLALRVATNGGLSWSLRYRLPDGRQRRYKLGTYPATPLATARTKATEAIGKVEGGGDPYAEDLAEAAAAKAEVLRTFDDLTTAYFTACELGEWRPRGKKKAASTLAEERGLYRRHIKAPLGSMRPEEITRTDARALFRNVARKAPVQGNRVRSLVRQVFNFALDAERVTANPVVGLAAPSAETPRARVLSDAEIKAVWLALKAPAGLRVVRNEKDEAVYVGRASAIALQVALLTLQRRGEVAGIRLDEVDLEQATWLLPAARSKNRRAHLIPLSPPVLQLLKEAKALTEGRKSPFFFPSPKTPERSITAPSLSHCAAQVYLSLGIGDATLHDYRRTGASLLAGERLGVSEYVVGRILNHAPTSITSKVYLVQRDATEKRIALDAWARLLAEITGEASEVSNVVAMDRGAA